MQSILITGGQSTLALRLASAFPGWQITLAAYGTFTAINLPAYTLISVGPQAPNIPNQWLHVAISLQVEYVLPLLQTEIAALANTQTLFEEFGIQLILPCVPEPPAANLSGQLLPGSSLLVMYKGDCLNLSPGAPLPACLAGTSGVYTITANGSCQQLYV